MSDKTNPRVLVCGGRGYKDYTYLCAALDSLEWERGNFSCVIHGAAQGADVLAGQWAKSRGRKVKVFPAEWSKHGKAAGPIRNAKMLEQGLPDLVVAFPGGVGTADMVARAKAAGVEVVELKTG